MMNKQYPLGHRRQLHWELAERLREDIGDTRQPGDALDSVRALARTWGVSVAVVRSAQALLQQEGLIEVRHGAGAHVTEAAGKRRVGLYSELDLLHPRASSFHAVQVRHLRDWFEERGIETEFYMGRTQPGETLQEPTCTRFVEDLESGRLHGAVMIDRPETAVWNRLMRDVSLPVVGTGTDYVAEYDYGAFLNQGIQLLADKGVQRLAVLSWAEGIASDIFLRAAAAHNLETRPHWHRHDLHPQLAGAGWEEFREIWGAYPEKPDGLLVCDDQLLAEAAMAIAELGIRVPDDLQIVSHRNAGNSARYPFPVTWIEFDPAKAANAMAEALMQRMDGKPLVPQTLNLNFTVVPIRNDTISAAKPREPKEVCRNVFDITRQRE